MDILGKLSYFISNKILPKNILSFSKICSYSDLHSPPGDSSQRQILEILKKYSSHSVCNAQKLFLICVSKMLMPNEVFSKKLLKTIMKKHNTLHFRDLSGRLLALRNQTSQAPAGALPLCYELPEKYSLFDPISCELVSKMFVTKIFPSKQRPALVELHCSGSSSARGKGKGKGSARSGTEGDGCAGSKYQYILKKTEQHQLEISLMLIFENVGRILRAQLAEGTAPVVKVLRAFPVSEHHFLLQYEPNSFDLAELEERRFWEQPEQKKEMFFRTSVGAFLMSFVFGIGDRHYENILISEHYEMFNIDFGFVFGEKPLIDTGMVAMNRSFRACVSSRWEEFKSVFVKALRALEKQKKVVWQLMDVFLSEYQERDKWKAFVEKRLERGNGFVENMLENAVNDKKTKLKNYIHRVSKSLQG